MNTNSPVFHILIKRRSEIAGYINHLEGRVSKAKMELVHLDATLGIMGYDVPRLKIRAKRPCTSGLFHRNELGLLVIGKLRENYCGLTLKQITRSIATDKGWDTTDKRFMTALVDKVGKRVYKMKRHYGLACEKIKDEWVWKAKQSALI